MNAGSAYLPPALAFPEAGVEEDDGEGDGRLLRTPRILHVRGAWHL